MMKPIILTSALSFSLIAGATAAVADPSFPTLPNLTFPADAGTVVSTQSGGTTPLILVPAN